MVIKNKSTRIRNHHPAAPHITGLKKPKGAIRWAEKDYSELVDNIAEAIFKSRDGVIVWCNNRVEEIYGYTKEELIGKPASFFITEDIDISELAERVYRTTEAQKHFQGTTAVRRKDGETAYIEFSISRLSHKGPPEFITVARDITERKQREQEQTQKAVARSGQYYRSLIENSIDVIVLLDKDGSIKYESPSMTNLVGYTFEERKGKNAFYLIHPDDLPNLTGIFTQMLRNEVIQAHLELRLRHKDGSWRHIEAIGNNLLDDPMVSGVVINLRDITERKVAEQELLVKEKALDNSINSIAMTDMEGRITYINHACLKLWGNPEKEELLGQPYWELLKPDDVSNARSIAQSMVEKQAWSGELIGRRKDGTEICVEVLAAIINDDQGNPIQTISSFIDVTDRKKAEQALRESEDKFRRFLEEMSDGYCVIQGSKIVFANAIFEQIFGYTQAETTGRSIQEFLPPGVVKELAQMYSRRTRGDIMPPQYETTLIKKDGTECPVEFGARLIDYAGKPAVSVVVRDITARKRMEKALQESEIQFRTIFDRTAVGMVLIDMRGKPVEINPALQRMLGYRLEELRNMSTVKYLHPDDAMADAELFTELVAGDREHYQVEKRHVKKDGTVISARQNVSLIRDADGKPQFIIVMIEDITERKEAEEALSRSERYFRSLIENSSEGIVILNGDGTVRYKSPSFKRVLGYGQEEEIGAHGFLHLHTDDLQKSSDLFTSLLEHPGSIVSAEVRTQHKDGSWRYIEVTGQNLLDDPVVAGIVTNIRDVTERKEAEEALSRSERYFRSLIENSSEGIVILNGDGTIRYESSSLNSISGYDPGKEIGKNAFDHVHPDDMQIVSENYSRLLEKADNIATSEMRVRHTDGSWHYIELTGHNLLHDPIVAGIVVNLRDISERKQAENLTRTQRDLGMALSTAESLDEGLRLCLDAALNVSQTDCGGIYLIDKATGALDMHFHKGLPADFIKAASHLDADSANTCLVMEGKPVYAKYDDLGVPKDDTEQHEGLRAIAVVPVYDNDQVIGCLNVASHTIDDIPIFARDALDVIATLIGTVIARLRDAEALQRSEERLKLYLESSPDAIYTIDFKGTFLYVNKATERLTGYSREEMLSKSFIELGLVPPEYLRKGIKTIKLTASGISTGPDEFEFIRKDGSRVFVESSNLPLKQGDKTEILAISRDITERKKIEQQLQFTGRLAAVGELAAGVAHELNNPLAAVQAYAQLLNDRDDLDETVKSDVGIIYSEAQRASRITGNLLSFAREHKPEKRLVSINQVVEKSMELHAYRLKVNNIEMDMELDTDLPMTMADFHQLQQVFVNIITNAEQAMTEAHGRGKLHIETQRAGRFIRIVFTDDGPGIPEENLKRTFDPFFTTKDVGKGTGLGLSICFGIIQGHHGNIYARSNNSEGASFVVELPILPEDEPIEHQTLTSWA